MDIVTENESHETQTNARKLHELNKLDIVTENESHKTQTNERKLNELIELEIITEHESQETPTNSRILNESNESELVTEHKSHDMRANDRNVHEPNESDYDEVIKTNHMNELERSSHELDQTANAADIESHPTFEPELTSHEMRPNHAAMDTDCLNPKRLRLNSDILNAHDETITLLRHCDGTRNGVILMLRDLSKETKDGNSEWTIDAATHDLRDSLTLELDEQRNHDLELSQLDDDIRQHINSTTEAIIEDFEEYRLCC
jgi:hypothetical protein